MLLRELPCSDREHMTRYNMNSLACTPCLSPVRHDNWLYSTPRWKPWCQMKVADVFDPYWDAAWVVWDEEEQERTARGNASIPALPDPYWDAAWEVLNQEEQEKSAREKARILAWKAIYETTPWDLFDWEPQVQWAAHVQADDGMTSQLSKQEAQGKAYRIQHETTRTHPWLNGRPIGMQYQAETLDVDSQPALDQIAPPPSTFSTDLSDFLLKPEVIRLLDMLTPTLSRLHESGCH
ncbi:uncharacterized protein EV420DRAFT_1655920 [Desarmillaria tabescens]|uniref:Uncharacterized protein n=1 Tax=Armillaria tabescens TaxID=1929756 RepID=A0AA39IXB2_ARMTA|nr:uncharacterized protein EV420DRAFT_1655920 [Desarmillaria tabescens]KAK0432201.1 hypothetical protein EV420DRAFT_1655920 [Desarmillaria tabescens]